MPDERHYQRGIVIVTILLATLCSACESGSMSDAAIPAACSQIGAQCQRPEGPIGVCQETHCAAGAQPPCFTCTSQH